MWTFQSLQVYILVLINLSTATWIMDTQFVYERCTYHLHSSSDYELVLICFIYSLDFLL